MAKSKLIIRISVVFALFFVQTNYAQLNNFTLSVTNTPETCSGNGSLQFSVTGTQPGASISYTVFLLPQTTTPFAVTTSNSITNISAGTYRVIATQSLNGDSGTQQQESVLQNAITTLTYQLTVQNQVCLNDGKVTVSTTNGQATQYEIFAGPMIRPLQTSAVFDNLGVGQYSMRVFDACGEGVVQTFTIVDTTTDFNLNSFKNYLTTCTTSTFEFKVTRNGTSSMKYPLQIAITINGSGQAPITYNQTINSGSTQEYIVSLLISVPENTNFTYSVTVTNGCNETKPLPEHFPSPPMKEALKLFQLLVIFTILFGLVCNLLHSPTQQPQLD